MKHFSASLAQLEYQPTIIASLVKDISTEQAHWKPDAKSWSIFETVAHLYAEEIVDFRPRLAHILRGATTEWRSIEADERVPSVTTLQAALAGYLAQRQESLAWLRTLKNPNWQKAYVAPFGPITAGDMFTAWVAHDLHHSRQLNALRHQWLVQQQAPYTTRYAGVW